MDLLFFYINQIFSLGHIPMPSEVCGGDETMIPICFSAVSFATIYGLLAIIFSAVILFKNYRKNFIYIPSFIISILLTFFLADYSIKQIQSPIKFGIEWFVLSYYLWCFVIISLFIINVLFYKNTKRLLIANIQLAIIFTAVLAYTGRGNIEQITLLLGGLLAKFSWKFLWLSDNFKLLCLLFCLAFLYGFCSVISSWIKTGEAKFGIILKPVKLFFVYIIFILIPITSIPIGEYFNKADISSAKNFIDKVKTDVDKYYYENGEYPKFIEKMLPSAASPNILARHEYFTAGIRGTYYFSREDKYCFLFQNPTRKFGYYSITSERGWRFSRDTRDYGESFVALCDESNKSSDSLISNHLGIESEDEMVNRIAADVGAGPQNAPITPITAQKIIEHADEKQNESVLPKAESESKEGLETSKPKDPSEIIKKMNSEEFKEEMKRKILENPEMIKLIEQLKKQQNNQK